MERNLRTNKSREATQSTPTYRDACPQCGAKGVSTTIQEEDYIYGTGESEVKLRIEIPVHACKQCEMQFTDWVASEIQHNALCQHFGVLNPAQIKQLRKKHGMSRKAFAELTGLDEAYLKKLENGINIQNTAHDRLLRLVDDPVILNRLKQIVEDIKVPSLP